MNLDWIAKKKSSVLSLSFFWENGWHKITKWNIDICVLQKLYSLKNIPICSIHLEFRSQDAHGDFTCEQYPSWRAYMDSDITCLCVKVPLVLLERSIKKLQNFFLKIEWKFWIERDIQVFRHFRYFTPQMLRVQSQKSKNIGLLLQHQNVFFEIFWKLL